MATGAPSTLLMPAGLQDSLLQVIETRAQNALLLATLGANGGPDDLRALRNDQAFELGLIPPAVPGNN